jgi:hypothetical protein
MATPPSLSLSMVHGFMHKTVSDLSRAPRRERCSGPRPGDVFGSVAVLISAAGSGRLR